MLEQKLKNVLKKIHSGSGLLEHIKNNAGYLIGVSITITLSNLLIYALLAKFTNKEQVGEYRLLISIISTLELFSFPGASQVILKQVVSNFNCYIKPLLHFRMVGGLLSTAIFLAYSIYFVQDEFDYDAISLACLTIIAVFLPLYYAFNSVSPLLQSLGNYRVLLVMELVRNVTILVVVSISFIFTQSVITTAAIWVTVSILVPMLFYKKYVVGKVTLYSGQKAGITSAKRSSIILSLPIIVSILADHADKLVIGARYDLEDLAGYAIGMMVGRVGFVLAKPLVTALNPFLVRNKISIQVYGIFFVLLTLVGVCMAFVAYVFIPLVFGHHYSESVKYAAILLCGLGLYGTARLYYNYSIYNSNKCIESAVKATSFVYVIHIALTIITIYFFQKETALVLLSVLLLAREGLHILLLIYMSRKSYVKS